MQQSNPFQNLRFTRHRAVPRKPIAIGAVLVGFAALWWLVPPSVSFWLMLAGLAVIVWVASFGWRDAIRALQALLRRLEQS